MSKLVRTSLPADQLGTVQTTIGSGGGLESLILGRGSISENVGQVTIAVTSQSQARRPDRAGTRPSRANLRQRQREGLGASLSEQGFGGFALVLSGPQDELEADQRRRDRHAQQRRRADQRHQQLWHCRARRIGTAPKTYIRVDQQSALSYTGELETRTRSA